TDGARADELRLLHEASAAANEDPCRSAAGGVIVAARKYRAPIVSNRDAAALMGLAHGARTDQLRPNLRPATGATGKHPHRACEARVLLVAQQCGRSLPRQRPPRIKAVAGPDSVGARQPRALLCPNVASSREHPGVGVVMEADEERSVSIARERDAR